MSQDAPLLGPEHRQLGQAVDAEPARKATVHRGFRQDGGEKSEPQNHPDRALALAPAGGELFDALSGVGQEFVEPAMSGSQLFDETVLRLRSHRTLVLPQFVDALDDLASQTRSLRLSDAEAMKRLHRF